MTVSTLRLGPEDALHYEYDPPSGKACTFVFVNALTGSTATWQGEIAPALRDLGFGTLVYDFRGQANSPFAPGRVLDQTLIVEDLRRLASEIDPPKPIFVGLSIGGLFATWAILEGTPATGLVLINTLRQPGVRLEWINKAMALTAMLGGPRLVMDLYLPLLVNKERASSIRANHLVSALYEGLDPSEGIANLMANAGTADWQPPWEELTLPTLVITGLADRIFYDAEDVRAIVARLPNARRLDMDDAGHLIPVERPNETVAALASFAADLERP